MFVTDTAETDGGRVVTECKRLNHINFEKQCILGNMHKTINNWLFFVSKTKITTVLIKKIAYYSAKICAQFF